MARDEAGIGEAVSRVAEILGRLLTQHLHLLRSEAETEANAFVQRLRRAAGATARALPFVIAGAALVSLAAALAAANLLQPWLGQWSTPVALAAVGLAELLLGGRWLVVVLERSLRHKPWPQGLHNVPSRASETQPDGMRPRQEPQHPESNPGSGEESRYGAVG